MKPAKGLLLGILIGAIGTGSIGYAASETIQIDVTLPQVTYWFDGKRVNDKEETNVPDTIAYKGVFYVPARSFAEGLGHEVEWDAANQEVHVRSVRELAFEVIEAGEEPEELADWIQQSLSLPMAQVREYDEHTYILITRGRQTTGGYSAEVVNVKQYQEEIEAAVVFTGPEKGMLMTTELSFPYTLLRIKATELLPIRFYEVHGEVIPKLQGLSHLPHPIKTSESIAIFEPRWEQSSVVIRGAARSFAGKVSVALLDENGDVWQEQDVQALGEAPDWGAFDAVFEWKGHIPEELTVAIEVIAVEESDAERLEANITIPQSK